MFILLKDNQDLLKIQFIGFCLITDRTDVEEKTFSSTMILSALEVGYCRDDRLCLQSELLRPGRIPGLEFLSSSIFAILARSIELSAEEKQ